MLCLLAERDNNFQLAYAQGLRKMITGRIVIGGVTRPDFKSYFGVDYPGPAKLDQFWKHNVAEVSDG